MHCRMLNRLSVPLLFASLAVFSAEPPAGFQDAKWGSSPAQVRAAAQAASWQAVADNGFPEGLNVTVYTAPATLAGYPASVSYYFFENKFFQATVVFDFDDLKNFDFNYNVYISVNRYYREIHDRTITFVHDIYDLLRKKYGRKEPVFKGLDPRHVFENTDRYIKQETWNLRYHPYEYYKRIVAAAYARWDFPETRVLFSVNISAIDKRFDYQLSAVSLDLEEEVNRKMDALRSQGL
ncbi:MAG: hypothetical protein GF418_07625 [Chitinivibrionales bacterium]|nr:hypothetical protein [Chitinivibrionales bacterium]MBD3395482.1 hypothetical protein [Chitinivibrionales bacterium]